MIKAILFIIELKWLDLNRKGKFKILSSVGSNAVFVTNFGRFVIDRSRSAIVISGAKGNEEIPFGDVVRLEQGRHENSAVLEEIAMGGLDLKHDKVEWHTIQLILRDRRAVPVYAIGEYRINVPSGQRFMEWERKLFHKIGISEDGGKASSWVLERIRSFFADAGQDYPVRKPGEPPPLDANRLGQGS